MNSVPIRVVLADDHGVLRDGIRILVESQDDMHVVAEVARGDTVVDAVRDVDAAVLVMDLSMPGGGGLGAMEALTEAEIQVNILVLTMHEEPAYVQRALDAGALGYVGKRVVGTQLLDAIRSVADGRSHVSPDLLQALEKSKQTDDPDNQPLGALSPREQEVLRYVANGFTNQETADALTLSVKTVEGYRARLMRKLGARGRVDLVRHAVRFGLIDPLA
jgi:DNA-binding NarL/FixJ family response regulator